MSSMTETKITRVKTAGAFTKRIGNTVYRVRVHFSDSSTETAQDKIVRLIRTEAQNGMAVNL